MQLTGLQFIIFTVFLVHNLVMFSWGAWRRKKVTIGLIETTVLPVVIVGILLFWIKLSAFSDPYLMVAGVFLYLIGVFISYLGQKELGVINIDDFWVGRHEKKDRNLVVTGIYGYIRHPLLLSLIITYLGLILVFLHPVSIVLWGLLSFFCLYTARAEEKFLRERFPDYQKYMSRVGAFMPRRITRLL